MLQRCERRAEPGMPIKVVTGRFCGNCGHRAAIFATVDAPAGRGYQMVWA
jgi:hypothetical protein